MRSVSASLLTLAAATVAAVLVLQLLRTGGLPDPTAHGDFGARVLDIAVLVFREGLECIIVLAAVTANMVGARRGYQRPVAAGALAGAPCDARHVAIRGHDHRQPRGEHPRAGHPGRDRPARDHRAARRDELVLPQGVLEGLDLDAQPHEAVADSQRLRVESCGGASRCSGSRRSIAKGSRSCCSCKAIG